VRPRGTPNRIVERLPGFDVADVADVGEDDQGRPRDRLVEVLGEGEGDADIVGAADDQGGDGDLSRTSRTFSAEARAMARKPVSGRSACSNRTRR
jgi:hypothetical protein